MIWNLPTFRFCRKSKSRTDLWSFITEMDRFIYLELTCLQSTKFQRITDWPLLPINVDVEYRCSPSPNLPSIGSLQCQFLEQSLLNRWQNFSRAPGVQDLACRALFARGKGEISHGFYLPTIVASSPCQLFADLAFHHTSNQYKWGKKKSGLSPWVIAIFWHRNTSIFTILSF